MGWHFWRDRGLCSKTYNFFHGVLLLLHGSCERREAVCLAGANALLLGVLDKIHLQGTDTWASPRHRASTKTSCTTPLCRAVTSEDRQTYLLNMRKKGVYLVAALTEVRKSKSTGSRWASHSPGFSLTTLQMEDLSTSALRSSRLAQSAGSAGVRICEMFQRLQRCRLTCKGHRSSERPPRATWLQGGGTHSTACSKKKMEQKRSPKPEVLQEREKGVSGHGKLAGEVMA